MTPKEFNMSAVIGLAPFFAVALGLLTACPPPERPSDPEPGPADDGGTGEAACEDEQAKIQALEAQLTECQAPK